jgi:hypothetical protein
MLMPPKGAEKLASRLDPPEYGTVVAQCRFFRALSQYLLIGILYLWHTLASRETSSVDLG